MRRIETRDVLRDDVHLSESELRELAGSRRFVFLPKPVASERCREFLEMALL